MKEVVPKMARGEAQKRENPVGGELDPAEGVCRRCKKNSFYPVSFRFILPYNKRTFQFLLQQIEHYTML